MYYVKCIVCEQILYINTLYSNSNVVGVFIVNCCTVVSLTGSHPPPSLAAEEIVHPGARLCVFVCNIKNEFEIAVVNEPSVFEPLKFYYIYTRFDLVKIWIHQEKFNPD